MKEPVCTTEEIKAELTALQRDGYKCAVAYLKAELKRRAASGRNVGRPVTNHSVKHANQRRASKALRERKRKRIEEEGLKIKGETEEDNNVPDFDFGA